MRRKLSFATLFLVVLLALQLSLVAPEELEIRSPSEFLKVEDWNEEVQQNIQGVRLVESHEGSKEWELSAVDAVAKQARKSWELRLAKANFYGLNGVVYDIQCGMSEFFTISKEVHFFENVEVKSSNFYQFSSPDLVYLPKEKTLSGQKGVSLMAFPKGKQQSILKLSADEVAVNLTNNQIQLSGNVFSEQINIEKQNLELSADSAIFDQSGNRSVLEGNVNVKYALMELSGPVAEMIYDPITKQLTKLFVRGGVVVVGENRKASAKQLELDIDTETIILSGEPRLIQKNDELIGEIILFKNAGKTLEIKRAKAHINSNSGSTVLDE